MTMFIISSSSSLPSHAQPEKLKKICKFEVWAPPGAGKDQRFLSCSGNGSVVRQSFAKGLTWSCHGSAIGSRCFWANSPTIVGQATAFIYNYLFWNQTSKGLRKKGGTQLTEEGHATSRSAASRRATFALCEFRRSCGRGIGGQQLCKNWFLMVSVCFGVFFVDAKLPKSPLVSQLGQQAVWPTWRWARFSLSWGAQTCQHRMFR